MLATMMARLLAVVLMALAASIAAAHAQVTEIRRSPVVVELYTSQGCVQCPRANRLLGEFSRETDVLALTFPVGYWDYLGWADMRGLTTPLLVFDGMRQGSAADWDSARATLQEVQAIPRPAGGPDVSIVRLPRGRFRIAISGGSRPVAPADVWAVSFDPGPVTVTITSGENARRRITHYNLVRSVERAGTWNGSAIYFDRARCRDECAAIIQAPGGGPILAAAFTQTRRRRR
jgi:hypothetical protein